MGNVVSSGVVCGRFAVVDDAKDQAKKGPGGTRGGVGMFLLGLALLVAGGYLFSSNVIVTTGFWSFFGFSSFGLSLIPLFIGIVFLFFNAKSIVGPDSPSER